MINIDPQLFANKIGVNLPESFLQLISRDEENHTFNFKNENTSEIECGWKNIVVFAYSSEGNYLCFDYRDAKVIDPHVVLMLRHNLDEEGRMVTLEMAENFDDFLKILYSDPGINIH